MKSFVVGLLLLFTSVAHGAVAVDTVVGSYPQGFTANTNYVQNPDCTKNLANITASTTGVLSAISTSSGALFKPGSCKLNTTTDAVTIDYLIKNLTQEPGLIGQNCEVKAVVSGLATNWKAQLYINGSAVGSLLNNMPDTASGLSELVGFNVPCGSVTDIGTNGNAYKIRFTKVGTTSAPLLISQAYFGLATNIANFSIVQDLGTTLSFTPASFGTVSSAVWHSWRIGSELYVSANFTAGTTTSSTASIAFPAGILIDTTKFSNASTGVRVGTFNSPTGSTVTLGNGSGEAAVFYDGSTNNTLYLAYQMGTGGFIKANANSVTTSSTITSLNFHFPVLGWVSSGSAVRADQTNVGYKSTTTTITAITTSPVKGTVANDVIRWRLDGQDMIGNIEYSQTAAGSGTTGTGDYLITIPGGLSIDTSLVTINNSSSYGTGNAYNTKNRVGSWTGYQSTSGYQYWGDVQVYDATHLRFTGWYNTHGSTPGISAWGSTSPNLTLAAGGTVSFTAQFRVPISGRTENQKAPPLVGSVYDASSSSNLVSYATATATCSSSPCTIVNAGHNFTSTALTRSGTGSYAGTFTHPYSAIPACACGNNANGGSTCSNMAATTTGVTFSTTTAAGSGADSGFSVYCIGAP